MLLILLPVAAFGFRLQGSPPLGAVRVEPRAALPLRALPQMVASNDKHAGEKHVVDKFTEILNLLDVPEADQLLDGVIGLAYELLEEGRDLSITSPLSTFQEFDAELDVLQTKLTGGKLIRKKAQTWANVTSPAGALNDREQIDAAYEWSHEFFPNLSTPFANRTGRCRPSHPATFMRLGLSSRRDARFRSNASRRRAPDP